MADLTISQLEDHLAGLGHGTNLAKIKNPYALYHRAAMNVLSKIDPSMTIRIAQITNALHNDIFDYSSPTDLRGNKVIDLRPQMGRTEAERVAHRGIATFDLKKAVRNKLFTIRYNKGEKSLRIDVPISPSPITLHQMDSLTDNGTWAVGGVPTTNLTRDALNHVSGSASLKFDMDGSAVDGYIENSNMTAIDLENLENIGQLFMRFYIPDTSIFTSVTLTWGSSSTAYWYATATTPHDQTDWKTGWNIVRFDWNGASSSGSPDSSAVNYLKVLITQSTATAETDYRIDKIAVSAGEIWEIVYYSENLFRNSSGTWIAKPTDSSDLINLDEDGYNIFINECGRLMAQQQYGEDMRADTNFFEKELYGNPNSTTQEGRMGLYALYNQAHPSQALKRIEKYWDFRTYQNRHF